MPGIYELRAAIAAQVEQRYGLRYSPENEVLVTVGVSEALFLALKILLDPGDEVLVAEPCFVANPALVETAGGVPVMAPTSADNDFQVTGAALEARITTRTKAILLSYPSNPTGAVLTREHMHQVAAVAEKHDLVVISDEIYERLVYGTEHINFATLPDMFERTIVLERHEQILCHDWLAHRLCDSARSGFTASYVQDPPILDHVRADHWASRVAASDSLMAKTMSNTCVGQYDRRRRLIVDGFNQLGLTCFEPRGAFYAFPSIAITGMDDETFCEALLQEERLALIPGSAFGESGRGFVRASYATSEANLRSAWIGWSDSW